MKPTFAKTCVLILCGTLVHAAPFDDFPTITCGFQTEPDGEYVGDDLVALWLHGYASGVIATDPELVETAAVELADLTKLVREVCATNPDAELNSSVLNRLYVNKE